MHVIAFIRTLLVTLSVAVCLVTLMGCGNTPEEDRFKEEDRFNKCFKKFRKAAEQGNADAQYRLGWCYVPGRWLGDHAEVVKWWRKAAEQGHANAQCGLGLMYAKGDGVPEDDAEAVKWFRKAAEQGNDVAQFKLGEMYSRDAAEAVKWYRKAAEQGLSVAQNNLGMMYAKGKGVPKNHAEAVKWYRKAAEQGHLDARFWLKNTIGYAVPEDAAEAVKYWRKWAEAGNVITQFRLGELYHNGGWRKVAVVKDYAEAAKWYRMAAEQGDALAQRSLGRMYAEGKGVPEDDVAGYAWYSVGKGELSLRLTPSQLEKGEAMAREISERIEKRKAAEEFKWFRKIAEQGYAHAQETLSWMYANGNGVPEDDVAGYAWIIVAAASKDDNARSERRWRMYRSPGNGNLRGARDTIKRELTPAQIDQGQAMAREIFERIEKRKGAEAE